MRPFPAALLQRGHVVKRDLMQKYLRGLALADPKPVAA
jgi:hypothetical protein